MASVPRDFHFIFGLRPQTEALHLVHWLCLESCRVVNRPAAIHFHYRHLPHGPWWERIAPHLRLHPVRDAPAGFDPARYRATAEGRLIAAHALDYAHEADFLRLEILHATGGVYADMDTLFIAPYPDRWFEHDCTLGEEPPVPAPGQALRPSLCNAVILARPGAAFIARWIAEGRESFDGTWSRHSCEAASRLWSDAPGDVHVLPQRALYRHGPSRDGVASLLARNDPDLRGMKSLHLWAHLWWNAARTDFSTFHAGMVTPQWVRGADATYAVAARRFLPEGAG